jgi:glycosyltransferase involved in cell wall biosynthesis
VIVIPHGLLQFPHIDKSKKFDFNLDSKVVLLFFGNIQRYKGLDILIEAMRYLKNEDIKLLIAGKANINIDELKKRAEFLDISNKIVWHSEFIPDEDVQEIYDYCDIVILPHRHIDQSGVLMSAINFSKPVVASDTGGFSEIIKNGTHGYLFTPGDAFELSNKIKRILDDNSLRNMTKNIDLLKRSWKTWNEIAKITSSIYLNILNQNGKKET